MINQYQYSPNTNSPPPLPCWGVCEKIISQNHVLIAGATGSGKSVLLNDIIYTITAHYSPAGAKLILIDPKKIDLQHWRDIKHVSIYADETPAIVNALQTAISTMNDRYKRLQTARRTDYDGTRIFVIIDELADLMTTDKKAIFPLLQRLAQLGRASAIHLIAATQAPSRRIIPAELTLNFTAKIALHCDSTIESRQIINTAGAELLPRWGVGIMRTPEGVERINIPLTTPQAIAARADFWHK